jgi:hypothetical protein
VLSGLDQKTTVSRSWQLAAMSVRNNRSDQWIRWRLLLVSAETDPVLPEAYTCVCVCGGEGEVL